MAETRIIIYLFIFVIMDLRVFKFFLSFSPIAFSFYHLVISFGTGAGNKQNIENLVYVCGFCCSFCCIEQWQRK